jgi:hypothetical protein
MKETAETLKAADDAAAPLGKNADGSPVTAKKGGPPPPPDETGEMPNTNLNKAGAQEGQISPYLKGSVGTAVLAGLGAGIYMAVAGAYLQNTDGVEVKITKIEKVKDTKNRYKFTYETLGGQKCGPRGAKVPCIQSAFKPTRRDQFTFRNTHTTSTLDDVTALVMDVDDNAVIFELDYITHIGDGTPEWGYMTCHSSFKNQFFGAVRDTVAVVVDVAKDAGEAVLGGVCDVVKIPFFCDNWLDVNNWALWISIFIGLVSCLMCIYLLYSLV